MGTDGGEPPAVGTPRTQGLAQFPEQGLQVGDFPFQELADVNAGRPTGPAHRHDVSDLSEGQTEPAGATHEGQEPEDIRSVRAITGRRAAGRWENAAGLVQP